MTEQEKSEFLKQREDALSKYIATKEKEIEEYKKNAEQSRELHLPKQYQDQCDKTIKSFEAFLSSLKNDLKILRQAIANL